MGEFKWPPWPDLPWALLAIMVALVLGCALILAATQEEDRTRESNGTPVTNPEPMPNHALGETLARIEGALLEIQETLENLESGHAKHMPAGRNPLDRSDRP